EVPPVLIDPLKPERGVRKGRDGVGDRVEVGVRRQRPQLRELAYEDRAGFAPPARCLQAYLAQLGLSARGVTRGAGDVAAALHDLATGEEGKADQHFGIGAL